MTEPDDDDILAGELALGLLEGTALSSAERRAAVDPRFAAMVEEWRQRLAPMTADHDEAPPERVWTAIQSQTAIAANDDAPSSTLDVNRALRRWRGLAIASSTLAASLALALVTRPAREAPAVAPVEVAGQAIVATLQSPETPSIVTISADASGRLLVTPVRLRAGERSSELWIIPGDGKPRSLGIINARAPSVVIVQPNHRTLLQAGASFAISLEPVGGSPTGLPTGPVVASGKIITI